MLDFYAHPDAVANGWMGVVAKVPFVGSVRVPMIAVIKAAAGRGARRCAEHSS